MAMKTPVPLITKPACLLFTRSLATALFWISVSAWAGFPASFTVGGLMFGDIYHVPINHSEVGDGAAGIVMRRGYLTFDADFNEQWFSRLRFEANQSGEFETYTFEVDFKDLYLGRRFGGHRLLLGLSPTPTFDLIESIWGARYLARTPMDLQGVASRDLGLSLQGSLSADGSFSYRAMVGTGTEFGTDREDGRKWMGAVTWRPEPGWVIDLYGDYEQLSGPRDRTTLQGFLGFQGESMRWGVQYSHQDREQDPPLQLVSGFLVAALGERWSVVARVDRLLEPSPKGDAISYLPYDPSARATTLYSGVEYRLGPHVRLTPNTVITRYDRNDAGIRPRSDVYLRLTLFLDFE